MRKFLTGAMIFAASPVDISGIYRHHIPVKEHRKDNAKGYAKEYVSFVPCINLGKNLSVSHLFASHEKMHRNYPVHL